MAYVRASLQRRGFDRCLAVIEQRRPAAAAQVRRTTGVLLREALAHPHRDAAWTSGLLNGTGSPIEFSFSSLSDDIRYAVEIGTPQAPPAGRLARIQELSSELDRGGSLRETASQLHELQTNSAVQWGAWLGVRHWGQSGSPSYKIYAETPSWNAATSRLADRYLPKADLFAPAAALVLVAKSPDSERSECYFKLKNRGLPTADLACLLGRVGLDGRSDDLVDLIRSCEFCPPPARRDLPEAQFGFSYSTLPGGKEPVFTVFAYAWDFVGGDGAVRWQMLRASASRNWSLGLYPWLTEPVAGRLFQATYHNIISFIVGPAPMAGLQVSLSPPPEGTEDGERMPPNDRLT